MSARAKRARLEEPDEMDTKDTGVRLVASVTKGVIILLLTAAGVATLASAARCIEPGRFAWGSFLLNAFGGLAYLGAAVVLVRLTFARQAVDDWLDAGRQRRYGEQPWMLKREWRKGRIIYRRPPGALPFLWIFALGWNAGLGFLLYTNRDMILPTFRRNWLYVPLMAFFALAGLVWLYAAVRMTFTMRKAFTRAVFTMDEVPGVIGGKLRGTVQTYIPNSFTGKAALNLTCTSSGRFTAEIPRMAMREAPRGLQVPVDFDIPDSCEGTNIWGQYERNVWTLEARADLGCGTLDARFEVPVFKLPGRKA